MIGLVLVTLSLMTAIAYAVMLDRAVCDIPSLSASSVPPLEAALALRRLSIVIPAYNEAENIHDCLMSVLNDVQAVSSDTPLNVEIWMVDDRSTDTTLAIAQALQHDRPDPRLHLLSGLPRPTTTAWKGKNWACAQAMEHVTGEYVLFLDADVQLKRGAIAAVMQRVEANHLDFLNVIPAVVCDSPIEWMVQPIIFINLLISLNSAAVKDPNQPTTYAAGPFMLFRRDAYAAIGGHQGVADQVAEDVALARKLKQKKMKMEHGLGASMASLRMYRTVSALWEGWTKVLYVGAHRSVGMMGLLVVVMMMLYSLPWMIVLLSLWHITIAGFTVLSSLTLILASLTISIHYFLRSRLEQALGCPTTQWWLAGLGGGFVAIMAIASVIKTETGWGWTWRGRSLK